MLVTFLNASASFPVLPADYRDKLVVRGWNCNPLQGRQLQSARNYFTVLVTAQTAFVVPPADASFIVLNFCAQYTIIAREYCCKFQS
jgi:hypothetical protein